MGASVSGNSVANASVLGAVVSTGGLVSFVVSFGEVLPQAVMEDARSNTARSNDTVFFIGSPFRNQMVDYASSAK